MAIEHVAEAIPDSGQGAASRPRERWALTKPAFDALLDSLGTDRNAAAEQYLAVRRNLVRFFEWRGCATPEEYADESLNRCAKRVSAGDQIRDISIYAIGVARMLIKELRPEQSSKAG